MANNLGKSLKAPKMQFHEKNFLIHLISRVFLPGLFKFFGPLWVGTLERMIILNKFSKIPVYIVVASLAIWFWGKSD